MYRVVTKITIEQKTQITGQPARGKIITFDFVNTFTVTSNWRDLTNGGEITLPKNLYVRDATGTLVSIYGTNKNIGGFTDSPLFLRGDKITIDWGYRYMKDGQEVYEGTDTGTNHLFVGWISEVRSKKPFVLKVEDNMWMLKQIPAPVKVYPSSTTLEGIVSDLLKGTDYKVQALTKTTFGNFRVGNETVASVLSRLQKDFHFEFTFVGNTLRCGSHIYIESEAKERNFYFQGNIIEDSLEYRRKDDIQLSVIAWNSVVSTSGKTTKDGKAKTKKERIEVMVSMRNGSDEPEYTVKSKGVDFPENVGGERMTLQYPGAKTIDELKILALAELKKYHYSGFKGKFTTFGLPFCRFGDTAILGDAILPERNGKYRIRSVEYTGGVEGLRQVVELDYKVS